MDTYLTRSSYIYGTDKNGTPVYGQAAKDTFESVLKNVQATVQVRDSTYGVLDNDDVAQYLGGLTLAAKWASGKDVDSYIANTRLGVDNLKIQTLREFVSQELDSRLLNPKFVEAMLKEGYAGSETLAKWISNTFLIDATTGAISDNDWHDLAATYIFNDAVRAKLDPYALQAMIGYEMEAARKGMWQASKEDLTQLSNAYMQTMVDYGVVCSQNTCKNVAMNEWLAQFSTLDDSVRKQFQEKLADATQQNVNIAMQNKPVPTTTSHSSSSDKVEGTTQLPDLVVNDQPESINSEQLQLTATQEQTVSNENTQDEATAQTAIATQEQTASTGNTQNEATAQTSTAVAAAGNLPAASGEQVKPEANDAQKQNTAGEQVGKTQEYKAYEMSEEGKQNKASGVSMWALIGVGGVMAAAGFGIMKGKIMSR